MAAAASVLARVAHDPLASSSSSRTASTSGSTSTSAQNSSTTSSDRSRSSSPSASTRMSSSSNTAGTAPTSGLPAWERSKAAWLAPDSGWELSGQQELSHLVKMATAQAHTDVLRPPIVDKLIMGKIPLLVHVRFLVMLYQIYDALEVGLADHADHGRLASTYNPSVLARTELIGQDINHFLGLAPSADWKQHEIAKDVFAHPPVALSDYKNRIQALTADDKSVPATRGLVYPPAPAEPWLLLAHAYVRYMGDLNGGQMIKNSVAKGYHLDPEAQDGLRFYAFQGPEGLPATPAELSKLTAAFRKGIDATGKDMTAAERAAFLQEANHAFELNIRLFSSFSETDEGLTPPSRPASPATPHIPAPSLEGYAKAAAYMPASLKGESTKDSVQVLKKSVPYNMALLAFAFALPILLLLFKKWLS